MKPTCATCDYWMHTTTPCACKETPCYRCNDTKIIEKFGCRHSAYAVDPSFSPSGTYFCNEHQDINPFLALEKKKVQLLEQFVFPIGVTIKAKCINCGGKGKVTWPESMECKLCEGTGYEGIRKV